MKKDTNTPELKTVKEFLRNYWFLTDENEREIVKMYALVHLHEDYLRD